MRRDSAFGCSLATPFDSKCSMKMCRQVRLSSFDWFGWMGTRFGSLVAHAPLSRSWTGRLFCVDWCIDFSDSLITQSWITCMLSSCFWFCRGFHPWFDWLSRYLRMSTLSLSWITLKFVLVTPHAGACGFFYGLILPSNCGRGVMAAQSSQSKWSLIKPTLSRLRPY